MRFQLVDPSYCVTTDLTYHKFAIKEGVHALYPKAIINIHRYYFEIEDTPNQGDFDILKLNCEIASRDSYLKSLYKPYPLKSNQKLSLSPLLFKQSKI